MWHIFWRGYSRLRSGREHWAWMVVVEVRQGTLGGDTRGWGPAGNTGRGWSWLRSGREHWEGCSWLRSGREHWAGMLVVEVRQGTLSMDGRGWGPAPNNVDCGSQLDEEEEEEEDEEEENEDEEEAGRQEEERKAANIKSNNPHLAGGEKIVEIQWLVQSQWSPDSFSPSPPRASSRLATSENRGAWMATFFCDFPTIEREKNHGKMPLNFEECSFWRGFHRKSIFSDCYRGLATPKVWVKTLVP